jgi:hypothetical protein
MSFEALKRSRGNFDKLTKELESLTKTTTTQSSGKDERFWRPELDKSGNGYAVIRFLPAVEGEELPWARVWSHAFQGPGGWYIENSLTTMNKKDPVSEDNSRLWNTGLDSDKEIARKRKRKLTYYTNVLIVSDPKNPENEGQVKLFKFGKKIFDKITEAMQPQFEDEKPLNPFDFWEGANFKLKIRKVDGYWNYDKSEFDSPSPLADNDDDIQSTWKKQYALSEFSDPSTFKSYDELKARFEKVVYGTGTTTTADKIDTPTIDDEVSAPVVEKKSEPKQSVAPVESNDDDGDDDTMDYFSKLVEED